MTFRWQNNVSTKFLLLTICSTPSYVYAGVGTTTKGPASEYIVTLKKVELCTAVDCGTAHTLVTKTTNMDIAGAAVGATVGSYASTMTLPPMGIAYTHMRSTVDRTFTITGYAASTSSGYCYTKTGTPDTNGSATAFETGDYVAGSASAANAGSATLELVDADDIPINGHASYPNAAATWSYSSPTYAAKLELSGNDMLYTAALGSSYTYTGKSPIIDISFGTENAVTNVESDGVSDGDCNLSPGEPEMTVTIK